MNLISFVIAVAQVQSGLGAIPGSLTSGKPAGSAIVAKVNGTPIRASDIEPLLWDSFHTQIEQDYINYLTVKTAADAVHIVVTDAETRAEYEDFLKRFQASLPKTETLEAALQAQSTTKARLFLKIRTQLLLNKLALKDFKPAQYVKVSTMIFGTASDGGTALQADVARANEAYGKLVKGAAWEAVLPTVTSETRVVKTNGSIGWRPLDAFPKAVVDDFASTKPGGFTKPEKTANGIQIFRLDARGMEAKGTEAEELKSYYIGTTRATFIQGLKSKTKVEKF